MKYLGAMLLISITIILCALTWPLIIVFGMSGTGYGAHDLRIGLIIHTAAFATIFLWPVIAITALVWFFSTIQEAFRLDRLATQLLLCISGPFLTVIVGAMAIITGNIELAMKTSN